MADDQGVCATRPPADRLGDPGFLGSVDQVVELEKAGVGIVLVPEAYSFDAISQLGYLAAKTSTMELGSGVVPIYTRTPALLAMTAAGLDYVSDGRFVLGIGTFVGHRSGPVLTIAAAVTIARARGCSLSASTAAAMASASSRS